MDKIEIVIVTGMSGAGKTTAMAAFENMAYRCIDNYPIELLGAFSEYLKDNTAYSRIAMAVSLDDAPKAIRFLSNVDWLNVSVIFLDCDDNIILKRYKETRRSHPILISNKASTLLEAIEYERKLARPISKEANVVIDTTQLKGNKFQQILENQFNHQSIDPFRISFVSFGYKHGIPKDADLLFDVRFLPNPYYVEGLRAKTGNDKEIQDYVMQFQEANVFLDKLEDMLEFLIPNYITEGKNQLVISIGCTGGKHRSVTLANELYKRLSGKKGYGLKIEHRDIGKDALRGK